MDMISVTRSSRIEVEVQVQSCLILDVDDVDYSLRFNENRLGAMRLYV